MAKVTQLSVMGLPGRVRTFSAKTESAFTVTFLEPVQVALGLWVVRWTSNSTGPFTVYRDGKKLGVTYQLRFDIYTDNDDESPVIEVIADPAGVPVAGESSRVTLRWASSGSAIDYYLIEQFIASVWTEVARMRNTSADAYAYRSNTLDDDTNHQFRVSAVGTNGNVGSPLTLSRYMIRQPDPPDDASIEYDASTGKIAVVGMA